MKKIMLIVLAAAALLLCGCGKERPLEAKLLPKSDVEYSEIILPPRHKLISVQRPYATPPLFLYRPFREGEKAEEYFFIGEGAWGERYKIKEQE